MNKTRKLLFADGRYALIDEEDYELIYHYEWKMDPHGYVIIIDKSIEGESIRLHNLLIDPPKGKLVDHVNNCPWDNRKCNLRHASVKQNAFNSKMKKNNKAGYKGVSWFYPTNKWRATIWLNNQTKTLGYFLTKEEAALAYNKAAKENFGDFARLNIINHGSC